jgi:hypothetical protein
VAEVEPVERLADRAREEVFAQRAVGHEADPDGRDVHVAVSKRALHGVSISFLEVSSQSVPTASATGVG